jgi:hypothetical protein
MEKSLPYIPLHGKEYPQEYSQECSQECFQEQVQPHVTSKPPSWPVDGYDTHLLPHISLPQRPQQAVGGPQVGLLRYVASTVQGDPGLTIGIDKYELAHKIATAKSVQATPPVRPVAPAPISYMAPAPSNTLKQQYMQAQQANARKFLPPLDQLADNPSGKQSIGSEKLRDIRRARTRVVIKALVTFGMFAGVACVIWTLFSRNSVYLIVMFLILAMMLGSILSTSMSDYYQLGLSKFRTTLRLRAVDSPRMSDAMQGVRAPHLRMQDDTSGYLDALRRTFPKEKERRPHM